jgi:hypothetical protein
MRVHLLPPRRLRRYQRAEEARGQALVVERPAAQPADARPNICRSWLKWPIDHPSVTELSANPPIAIGLKLIADRRDIGDDLSVRLLLSEQRREGRCIPKAGE